MQAAAMRRVDRLGLEAPALQPAPGEAGIGASLGAVAVQHVDPELAGELGHLSGHAPVAEADLPGHGDAGQTERAIVGEPSHGHWIAFGSRVANDADLGAETSLGEREVVDVAEQAAYRRAQAMQNA